MITLSDIGKVLTQIDKEIQQLNEQSLFLTKQINSIMETAFESVKRIGLQQEEIIQRRIALKQTAVTTIMKSTL